jgi:hypothetical protein
MSLNADTIELLLSKGLTGDDILAVARSMEKRRDPTAADRMAKMRARRKAAKEEGVTDTANVTRNPSPNDIYLTPTRKNPTKPNGLEPHRKKHRLPVDWEPKPFTPSSQAAQAMARWEPGRLERELAKFRDHHTAAGSRFECWQAAWGKWTNNSRDFERGSQNGGNHQHLGKSGQAFAMQGNLSDDRPF